MVFPNYKLGNFEEAIELLRTILKTKSDLEYVNGLGELLIKTNKYQEFIDYIKKLLEEENKNLKKLPLDIIVKYGECLFKLNNSIEAEKVFSIVLSHDISQVTDLVRAIAMMYETEGDEKTSLKYYLILANTMLSHEKQGENSEDEEENENHQESQSIISPEVEFDILKCCFIFKKIEKIQEAENILLRGLKIIPNSFEIRKELSEIYRSKGDINAAINITNQNSADIRGKEWSESDYNPNSEESEGNSLVTSLWI